jgi:hypothetical protein
MVERMFGQIAFAVRLAAQWIGSDFSCHLYLP